MLHSVRTPFALSRPEASRRVLRLDGGELLGVRLRLLLRELLLEVLDARVLLLPHHHLPPPSGVEAVVGKELAGVGWKTYHSKPDLPVDGNGGHHEFTDDILRDAIKETLLDYSEQLTVEAGYAAGFKSDVYGALTHHMRDKFTGTSLGLADRQGLIFAWKMLPQMRKKVAAVPGLVAGIIEHGRNQ